MRWKTYRARPLTIQAVQWNGLKDTGSIQDLVGHGFFHEVNFASAKVFDRLHNSWVIVKAGDYVAKGLVDEFYPIDPKILRLKYELISTTTDDTESPLQLSLW